MFKYFILSKSTFTRLVNAIKFDCGVFRRRHDPVYLRSEVGTAVTKVLYRAAFCVVHVDTERRPVISATLRQEVKACTVSSQRDIHVFHKLPVRRNKKQ